MCYNMMYVMLGICAMGWWHIPRIMSLRVRDKEYLTCARPACNTSRTSMKLVIGKLFSEPLANFITFPR